MKIKISRPGEVNKICNHALRSIFEVATWLRNFSILNGVACDKIISKCKKHLGEFWDDELCKSSDMNVFLTEYSK